MWSLYVPIQPIHVKCSKVKMKQAEVGLNIAQNHLFSRKRNWVNLKSDQTCLRIDCLANRKSYVVISCASSCENVTKS